MARPARGAADRRRPDRPSTGDLRPCPFCRVGSMVFKERHRFGADLAPAWVCQNPACGYRNVVRQPTPVAESSAAFVRASKAVHAEAQRAAMKARAQVARAKPRLASDETRLSREKPRKRS